jgi:D-beta-D-heptose 7-phosphate kinase/D-beta-D-heptose 1-phosphate adenosyltransferase
MASPKLPPKTIGFTYGTFDLLHDGHIYLLRRARRRCDQLIVAITSDRLARERKGQGRPVESEAVRSQNLIASGLPSLVVAVDDLDQLAAAMNYYQPDIMFVGDDNEGPPAHVSLPFRVVLIPMLPGYSTTAAIKDRLQ